MVLVARADSPPPWTAVAARRQPQLRDGQKVRRRQLHGIGVRGLRTRARLAVAFAVSWRDASIESDLQVQLPGLLLVLEGEEDDALCPHLLQLRRGVGRRGRRRGWKHLLSVELSRLGSILLLFLVFLITRYM